MCLSVNVVSSPLTTKVLPALASSGSSTVTVTLPSWSISFAVIVSSPSPIVTPVGALGALTGGVVSAWVAVSLARSVASLLFCPSTVWLAVTSLPSLTLSAGMLTVPVSLSTLTEGLSPVHLLLFGSLLTVTVFSLPLSSV
ncbi:Uncharacterised protein [Suttonella indologenes]|uniref:Uncharacterized protein n=1 Tax=Suttonella indologenes TaxID=13276 RepID=A0A380MLU9_9GAMM|nr:Uncharacterised protein [Suttonella indologenes]